MVTLDFDLAMADRDYVDYGWLAPLDIAERNRYIRECRLFLCSKLGAIVRLSQLLFWRTKTVITIGGQLKGFVLRQCLFFRRLSNARGLHIVRNLGSRWY